MKLIKVLNRLEKREITKFEHFLSSALFNKRSDVKLLFYAWKKQRRTLPPQEYWSIIFPGKSFSASQWNLVASRLFKLLENFLILLEMRKNEAKKKFYLAKAYRRLQDEKLFKEAIRDTGIALEKHVFRNTDYLQGKHDLAFEKYDYVISINRKERTNLQEVSDHFDTYFLSTKLKQACNALSRENINQEQYNIGLLDIVIQLIESNPDYLKTPAIAIYYYCYKAISSKGNEIYFLKLRETITAYQQYFPPAEMRDIYTVAINYSIKKLNTGSSLFIREAFELYLLSLDQGYLLEDGIMLESTYSNIVSLALKLNKYEWASNFIQEYQQHLKPAFQVPLFHFSMGKLYYEQDRFEESLQQLIQVETKASFLLLGARILQLKIYYELKEFDPLESLLESLRVYLQRSKDLAYRKEHYSNIIIFTKQLLQLTIMNKKEKEVLRSRIHNAEIFAEKEWFLKQVK